MTLAVSREKPLQAGVPGGQAEAVSPVQTAVPQSEQQSQFDLN